MDFPLVPGEGWWIVHPNNGIVEFRLPLGAVTVCLDDLLAFKRGVLYKVLKNENGWITVASMEGIYEMPQYIFARYFDAEVFVRGIPTKERIKEVEHEFNDKLEVVK